MLNIKLAEHQLCTGCGACALCCPTKSIVMVYDDLDVIYPRIDYNKCIQCEKCQRVCHVNTKYLNEKSDVVYAAYSTDAVTRKNSASGGVASTLYRHFLKKGWHVFGVRYLPGEKAQYFELDDEEDIKITQNSKYLFAETGDTYLRIQTILKNGEHVLFIGIPCQVSGLLSFLGGRHPLLYTVDLLCHGTCPSLYMDEHINTLEGIARKQCERISFRDPEFGTENYRLTLRENNIIFYNKGVYDTDIYQIGYHKGLIYRESCYHCMYAQNMRIGDLSLSDFGGLGKIEQYKDKKESISCIVVSSDAGDEMVRDLVSEKLIFTERRPSGEAFQYDAMFQRPTPKHKRREVFVAEYRSSGSFEKAAKKALSSVIFYNWLVLFLHIKEIKAIIRKVLR